MAPVPVQQLKKGSMPCLYSRQRLLLGLLDAIGGNVSNTDFQKLLFLYCKERSSHGATQSTHGLYDFVPYRLWRILVYQLCRPSPPGGLGATCG